MEKEWDIFQEKKFMKGNLKMEKDMDMVKHIILFLMYQNMKESLKMEKYMDMEKNMI